MKRSFFCHLIILLLCYKSSVFGEDNTINLNQGKVKGSYNILGNYWSYLGIPYAQFKGRFKEAGDPPSWNGTFNANRGTILCKQYSSMSKSVVGDEDCFTLNVYTTVDPYHTSAKQLSVIVFIFGGGFYKGSNSDNIYNPRNFVQKDVVFVTINYRVGAFGFLCLRNIGATGNMGLKDQLAALRWVKNNINSFGGDPQSLTIFGESVGASCVDYLVLTQTATGLFQKAIMCSGTSLTMQAFTREPILVASSAASRLGYNTTDPDELLEIFLNATADDVARVSYRDQTNDALAAYVFQPCIEDPKISESAILTKSPRALIKSARNISNISVIIGYNNKEGIFWAQHYDCSGLRKLDQNFTSVVPKNFIYKKPEDRTYLIESIRQFYFRNSSTNYDGLIDYFSDVLIMSPSVTTMAAYLTNPNISMFNYYFTYDSLRNYNKLQSRLRFVKGASHADELFYLFNILPDSVFPPIPRDQAMINRMTSFWTSFAKTGVPSSNMDITWPKSESTLKFLKLDKELEVIDLPNRDRIEFWKRSYENYTILA